jgi:predicted nucleic acid-binding protein
MLKTPAMLVINTSPVISLAAALENDFSILEELFGAVVVPQEVFRELAAGAHKDSTADLLTQFPFFRIRS